MLCHLPALFLSKQCEIEYLVWVKHNIGAFLYRFIAHFSGDVFFCVTGGEKINKDIFIGSIVFIVHHIPGQVWGSLLVVGGRPSEGTVHPGVAHLSGRKAPAAPSHSPHQDLRCWSGWLGISVPSHLQPSCHQRLQGDLDVFLLTYSIVQRWRAVPWWLTDTTPCRERGTLGTRLGHRVEVLSIPWTWQWIWRWSSFISFYTKTTSRSFFFWGVVCSCPRAKQSGAFTDSKSPRHFMGFWRK